MPILKTEREPSNLNTARRPVLAPRATDLGCCVRWQPRALTIALSLTASGPLRSPRSSESHAPRSRSMRGRGLTPARAPRGEVGPLRQYPPPPLGLHPTWPTTSHTATEHIRAQTHKSISQRPAAWPKAVAPGEARSSQHRILRVPLGAAQSPRQLVTGGHAMACLIPVARSIESGAMYHAYMALDAYGVG